MTAGEGLVQVRDERREEMFVLLRLGQAEGGKAGGEGGGGGQVH